MAIWFLWKMASQTGGSGILTASFQSLSQELALLRVSFDNWVGMKKRECIDSKETYNKTILEQNGTIPSVCHLFG